MIKSMLFAGACVLAAMPALAVTYTGNHTVGSATVTMSITTDGTLGALAQANVTGWSILLADGANSAELNTGNSTFRFFAGTALQASASQIFFDYASLGHIQWDSFSFSGNDAICLDTAGTPSSCLGQAPSEVLVINGSFISEQGRQGRFVLGTAGVVPEPASWAMLIAGFGLTGAVARRRARLQPAG